MKMAGIGRRARLGAALGLVLAACRKEYAPVQSETFATKGHPSETLAPKVDATPKSGIVQFDVGHLRACAARGDGHVVCWGPRKDVPAGATSAPRLVTGVTDAVEVAGDDSWFCARRKGGEVWCWGPDMVASSTGLAGVVEISSSCARHGDGHVSCWFDETVPRYPTTGADHTRPTTVAGVTARALGRGKGNPCVIDDQGAVLCWGSNANHKLAIATPIHRATPGPIVGLAAVVEIQTSPHTEECALHGGVVSCWGGFVDMAMTPKPIVGLRDVVHLAIGDYHSCALLKEGEVECWGSNESGQFGRPIGLAGASEWSMQVKDLRRLYAVEGIEHVVELRVGGSSNQGGGSTCVRKSDGSVWCWGEINPRLGPDGEPDPAPQRVELTPASP